MNDRTDAKIRSQFFSKIAHDIRNPLSSMKMALEVLANGVVGKLSEEQLSVVEKAQKHTDNINNLIKDISTLCKLESGDIRINLSHNDIHPILDEVCSRMEEEARLRGVSLNKKYADQIKPVQLDREQFKFALNQILKHCLSFSCKGSVDVICGMSLNNDQVIIQIKDSCAAFTQNDLSSLFDTFASSKKAESKNSFSTGLELAIAKNILQQHKGSISADSAGQEGRTFTISLPAADV